MDSLSPRTANTIQYHSKEWNKTTLINQQAASVGMCEV
jgi:hypothetical protein